MKGKFELIMGPMFSGKTTLLLEKLSELDDMGFKVMYINHSLDNRSQEVFSTHSSRMKNSRFYFTQRSVSNLFHTEIMHQLDNFDVIGIDEAQFFNEDIIKFCEWIVETKEKYLIVSGLIADVKRKKFGYIWDLIPYCDELHKLHSYCFDCLKKKEIKPANFTILNKEIQENNKNNQVHVGGSNVYKTVCRNCFLR